MDVEEIVALSVKHNVSDLHLCSDSPPRWRRTGRLEPAPFPSPDLGALLKAWLNDEQQGIWWANGGGFCRDGGGRPAPARQCL